MRRLEIFERILWGSGLVLIAIYLAARGYGEVMRRAELRRFADARESAAISQTPTVNEEAASTAFPATKASSASSHAATASSLDEPTLSWPARVDTGLWSPKRVRGYEESLKGDLGHPLAVLRIRRLDLEVPVLDGTDESRLNRGVGRIEGTAGIGQGGNVGIAGHRDGYFRCLKDIKIGDEVELETLAGIEHYQVDDTRIVLPSDVSVLESTATPVITLVTCYPFYYVGSAPQRFIVRARAK